MILCPVFVFMFLPPVDTYVMSSLTPHASSAATVSPPPTMLSSLPARVCSAMACAIANEPYDHVGCHSAMPTVPFQMTVAADLIAATSRSVVSVPASIIMSSSWISSKFLFVRVAVGVNSLATPLSSGNKTSQLFSLAYSRISKAVSFWSASYSELPTRPPSA